MCCQLGELKLKDGGDACVHIERIIALHEELASIGQPVSDEDLFNIIYASLPHSYNPGLTALSSTMRLHNKSVTSDDLMDIILEEYDRLTLQDGRKKKSSSEDTAFGLMLHPRKGNGKGNVSVATAITVVGWAIKSAIAGRKVVERQVKLRRTGSRTERNLKMKRVKSHQLL